MYLREFIYRRAIFVKVIICKGHRPSLCSLFSFTPRITMYFVSTESLKHRIKLPFITLHKLAKRLANYKEKRAVGKICLNRTSHCVCMIIIALLVAICILHTCNVGIIDLIKRCNSIWFKREFAFPVEIPRKCELSIEPLCIIIGTLCKSKAEVHIIHTKWARNLSYLRVCI